MKLGCSTAGMISGKSDMKERILKTKKGIEYFSQLGFDICEIYLRFPEKKYCTPLFNCSKEFDVPIYSAHFSKNIFQYASVGSLLKKHLLMAEYLRCSTVVIHPPDLSDKVYYRRAKKIFKENLFFAETHNIKMTVENVPYISNCLDHLSKLVTEIDSEFFGVTMDTEFVYSMNETVEKYFDVLNDHIIHIHLRDYDGSAFGKEGKRKYILPGRGNLDFPSIIATIKKHYHYNLIIEAAIDDLNKLRDSKLLLHKLLI